MKTQVTACMIAASGFSADAALAQNYSPKPVRIPYFDCLATTPCVSGMVFFNWQDVP